jgi:hypothetical protein
MRAGKYTYGKALTIISPYMEKKKQLLIKVLTKLQPHRNLADGFLALIDSPYCTDKTIDGLITLLKDSLKMVKTDKEKKRFQKSLELVKKIRDQEEKENDRMTDKDLDRLLEDN